MPPKNNCCVYLMRDSRDGKIFYIGKSSGQAGMYRQEAYIRSGVPIKDTPVRKRIAEILKDGAEIEYGVIKHELTEKDAYKLKKQFIKQYGLDKLCNVTFAHGAKGYNPTETCRRNHSAAMLGKNTKDGIARRPLFVTLVDPEGKIHENITSVKSFALTNGLCQSSLNGVACGKIKHHKGWHLPGVEIKKRSWDVRTPQGAVFHGIERMIDFERQHGLPLRSLSGTPRTKFTKIGLGDGTGRAWHINDSIPRYTFRHRKTGVIYGEIVEPAQFARYHGVSEDLIRRLIRGDQAKTKQFLLVAVFTPKEKAPV